MASDEDGEFNRGESLSSFLGAAVPGSLSLAFYYFEVKPLFSMLPGQITAEQAYRLTAINSLLLFSGFIVYGTLKLMDVGSLAGRYTHWRFFQGGEEENE